MGNTSTKGAGKKSARQAAVSVGNIQYLASKMNTVLSAAFPVLNSCPDALYIMMATMGLESSFRIWPNKVNANHVTIGTAGGIGRSYYTDPLVLPLYRDPTSYSTSLSVLNEGLSAKALMATMGMYQVRGTRESKAVMSLGNYSAIAEGYGIMVNAGQSSSAVFTNDEIGAMRSIVMGCIIMEGKVRNRLKKSVKAEAMRLAVGDYLGKAGARDVLGTSPEMRMSMVAGSNNAISKTLAASGITRDSQGVFLNVNTASLSYGTSATTATNTGSSTRGQPAPSKNGCATKTA